MGAQELATIINTDHGHAVQVTPSNREQLLIYRTDADGVEHLYRLNIEKVDHLGAPHDNMKTYLQKPYSGNFTF